jgi:hypothetical protein
MLRYGYHDIQIEGHLSALRQAHLISSHPVLTTCVMLTGAGRDRGIAVLDALRPEARDYFVRACAFVRSVSFSSLASIVDAADAKASLGTSHSKSGVRSA